MRNNGQMITIQTERLLNVKESYPEGKLQGKKGLVEECIVLTCSWLLQHNYFDLDTNGTRYGGITWKSLLDRPVYTLNFEVWREAPDEMLLTLRNTRQYIKLRPTPQRFGGLRWWFICPECERRCTGLYMPPPGSVFLCRLCHNLSYFSSQGVKIEGHTVGKLRQGSRKEYWWRYPRWRRKRDRRPDYRDRGARLREVAKEDED